MANDMNSVTIIGNLVRDAELKVQGSGFSVMSFSIAVNRSRKKDGEWVDEASYFDCVLFGKQADALKQYMTKGKKIGLEGYLRQDRWTDSEGNKKSRVVIGCENVQLVGSKTSGDSSSYQDSGYDNGNYGGDADYGFNG